MPVAKDYDLNYRRDLVHIRRHFTNAARVLNAGNVAMIRSEIVLRIVVHTEPCPEGPKGTHKWPHAILFRVIMALDSGQTLDGGWAHNSNALAREKRRLVHEKSDNFWSICVCDLFGLF